MPDPRSVPSNISSKPPSSAELTLIAALREDLAETGFTNDGVAELFGPETVAALEREQVVPGQLRVQETLDHFQSPHSKASGPEATSGAHAVERQWKCAVLSGLWLLAVDVTAEQVDAVLPRTGASGLQELGLLHVEETAQGGFCRPTADLRPYQVDGASHSPSTDLWVASDLSAHQTEGPLPADHVLGVGGASLTLASATHRRQVRTALDLGTGCGIQLFHLLHHADHVVGTDLSPRALAFARFNLLLNAPALGLDPERLHERVELLEGSLLDPVAGRRFEMVVSNPPFVITPRSREEETADRYTYRDGGRRGDELMEELITGLPEVLAPGGTAQMLGNWEIPVAESGPVDQQDWCSRPRRWADTSGLDAWFIQRERQSPAQYAETWLRDASEERDLVEYRRRYADYLQDFDSRGVSGVGFGMIWLQRPAESAAPEGRSAPGAAPWRRFEELTGEVQQPLGPVLGRTAERALAVAADPQAVLARPLTVPGDVTEERHQRFGAAHPEVILARQGAGLRRVRAVSSAAAGFLGAADGEFAAAQLITAVVALLDDGETDAPALEESLRQEVLDLYVEGFLTDVEV